MSSVDQFDEECQNSIMDSGSTSNRAVTTRLHWKRIITFAKTMDFFLYRGDEWHRKFVTYQFVSLFTTTSRLSTHMTFSYGVNINDLGRNRHKMNW